MQISQDNGLRPATFDDFIGQPELKERLQVAVESAKIRNCPVDHILLTGSPGLGKTTLAAIIAAERGVNLHTLIGPAIDGMNAIYQVFAVIQPGDVIFIDEIHGIKREIEEQLYMAMEEFKIAFTYNGQPTRISAVDPFTLIGATTQPGKLSNPLLSRFTVRERVEYYDKDDLKRIVERSSGILGYECSHRAAMEIASRCRGTPRIANNLLRRVRDYAIVRYQSANLTCEIASRSLTLLGVDADGLNELDLRTLETIITKFGGGPVGVHSLSVAVAEDEGTLANIVEPYLIQHGYMQRTRLGRIATDLAYRKLNLEPAKDETVIDLMKP